MSARPSVSDRTTGWTFLVCGAMLPVAVAVRWATTGRPLWAESSDLLVNLAAPTLLVVMTALFVMFGAVLLEWTTSVRALTTTLVLTTAFIGILGAMCVLAPAEMVGDGRGAPRTETSALVTGIVMLTTVLGVTIVTVRSRSRRRSRRSRHPSGPGPHRRDAVRES